MSHGVFGGYPGCHTGYSTFRNANVAEWPDSWEPPRAEVREDKQWGSQEIKPGDIQYLRLTAGGGGDGDPLDRKPEAASGTCSVASLRGTCAKDTTASWSTWRTSVWIAPRRSRNASSCVLHASGSRSEDPPPALSPCHGQADRRIPTGKRGTAGSSAPTAARRFRVRRALEGRRAQPTVTFFRGGAIPCRHGGLRARRKLLSRLRDFARYRSGQRPRRTAA